MASWHGAWQTASEEAAKNLRDVIQGSCLSNLQAGSKPELKALGSLSKSVARARRSPCRSRARRIVDLAAPAAKTGLARPLVEASPQSCHPAGRPDRGRQNLGVATE